MAPNPMNRELEARREGAWWRVYALPLACLVLMCGATAYLAYAAFMSTHPRPPPIIIIPSDWSLYVANKCEFVVRLCKQVLHNVQLAIVLCVFFVCN